MPVTPKAACCRIACGSHAFGRFLRLLSLDELPELFNILRGEMSLVGPRPLLMEYLPLYSAEQMRRHDVLPGLTGWAQVHGRNALDWPARFALDVWYVDHWSFWLDIKILLMTLVESDPPRRHQPARARPPRSTLRATSIDNRLLWRIIPRTRPREDISCPTVQRAAGLHAACTMCETAGRTTKSTSPRLPSQG